MATAKEAGAIGFDLRLADGFAIDNGQVPGPELSLTRRALSPGRHEQPDIGQMFSLDEELGEGRMRHVVCLRRQRDLNI